MQRQPLCIVAFAAWLAAGAAGCARAPEAPTPRVLLVVLDTVRTDHVGAYGYDRGTTPHLDRFAATATRYRTAISTAPWTGPAHASLFTGLFPYQHGAHTVPVDTKRENVPPLSDRHLTLAEVFRETGARTAAIGANKVYVFNDRYGFEQGFDTFRYAGPDAPDVNREVLPWLREAGDSPFFLFVNYMDAHRPYNLTPVGHFLDDNTERDSKKTLNRMIRAVMGRGEAPSPELLRLVVNQYDNGLANLDEGLGELFEELRRLSLFDDTLIVIVSDHGEYHGEHLLVEHSKDVYQEAVSVPLIVKLPGQKEGAVVDTPVSSVDVPVMILEGTGLAGEVAERHPGSFPYEPGSHPIMTENYYTRLKDLFNPKWGARFNRVRRAWFEGRYKYIASSDGKNELYDLAADPGEQYNLVNREPERAAGMAERLRSFLDGLERFKPEKTAPPLNEKQKEQMRSLGYL